MLLLLWLSACWIQSKFTKHECAINSVFLLPSLQHWIKGSSSVLATSRQGGQEESEAGPGLWRQKAGWAWPLHRSLLCTDSIMCIRLRMGNVVLCVFMFNTGLAMHIRTVQAACWVRFDCTTMFDFPVPPLRTMITANSISWQRFSETTFPFPPQAQFCTRNYTNQ